MRACTEKHTLLAHTMHTPHIHRRNPPASGSLRSRSRSKGVSVSISRRVTADATGGCGCGAGAVPPSSGLLLAGSRRGAPVCRTTVLKTETAERQIGQLPCEAHVSAVDNVSSKHSAQKTCPHTVRHARHAAPESVPPRATASSPKHSGHSSTPSPSESSPSFDP